MFPAGIFPQVAINDKKMYPIYSKACELDIPVFVCAGIPGPRLKFAPQHVELIDEVMYDFPELTFVTRHGCQPWTELAVKLMLKWPGLHYSTSAFAPKHYDEKIIAYANSRGADKMHLRRLLPDGPVDGAHHDRHAQRPLQGRGLAQVPLRQRRAHPEDRRVTAATEPVTLVWTGAERPGPRGARRSAGPRARPSRSSPKTFSVPRPRSLPSGPRTCGPCSRPPATRFADRVFLVSPEDEEFTYADTVARVARVAEALARDYGVSKGDRVGFASANTIEYVLCYWAALSLGAVLANFNGWWTTPELAHAIELTQPVVVLADPRRLELLQKLPAPAIGEWPPLVAMKDAAAAGLSAGGPAVALPTVPIDEDDPAIILFTSGTTGRSKGATLTHRNWVHFSLTNSCVGAVGMAAAGISPEVAAKAPQPSGLFAAPIFHISGSGPLTNAPFSGMKLVLPPPGSLG